LGCTAIALILALKLRIGAGLETREEGAAPIEPGKALELGGGTGVIGEHRHGIDRAIGAGLKEVSAELSVLNRARLELVAPASVVKATPSKNPAVGLHDQRVHLRAD